MRTGPNNNLLLNKEGRIYHLNLKPDEIAENIVLVGDPARVLTVSDRFDSIEFKGANREFITHTGMVGKKRVSVISTGIGPDNIDIVVNELHALANIDFETGLKKDSKKSMNMIRVGTTGALQEDISPGSMIISTYGLGLDGLIYFYGKYPEILEESLTQDLIKQTSWPDILPRPYIVRAPGRLIGRHDPSLPRGITVTAPGFYGPQGRSLNLDPSFPRLLDSLNGFSSGGLRITNIEMETAPLYGLCGMLGHQALTICLALVNRITGASLQDYEKPMGKLADYLLETFSG
jgi:uridine phosphorylase